MTVTETANYIRCGRQRVYDLLSAGRLTRHKDGSRALIERADALAQSQLETAPLLVSCLHETPARSAKLGLWGDAPIDVGLRLTPVHDQVKGAQRSQDPFPFVSTSAGSGRRTFDGWG